MLESKMSIKYQHFNEVIMLFLRSRVADPGGTREPCPPPGL